MTLLSEIREELSDAIALLEQYERALAKSPQSSSLQLNIHSLKKRKRRLEARIREAAAAEDLDQKQTAPDALRHG